MVTVAFFGYRAFTRFHFPADTSWPLPELQWNHQQDIAFRGARPQIIGHRGSGVESSDGRLVIGKAISAVRTGIASGVDWIEIDIRATRAPDSQLVVFHDETIDRKTTGEGAVSELSIADLNAARIHVDPLERIPTLDDVFNEFHDQQVGWIFDIKANGIDEQVLEWLETKIKNGELTREHVILFGTYDILLDYRDSGFALGYTAVWGLFGNCPRILFHQSSILDHCDELECDYLVLPVIFANPSILDAADAAGLNVWVYGVNDPRDMNYLTVRGATGFITDFPEKLIATLD